MPPAGRFSRHPSSCAGPRGPHIRRSMLRSGGPFMPRRQDTRGKALPRLSSKIASAGMAGRFGRVRVCTAHCSGPFDPFFPRLASKIPRLLPFLRRYFSATITFKWIVRGNPSYARLRDAILGAYPDRCRLSCSYSGGGFSFTQMKETNRSTYTVEKVKRNASIGSIGTISVSKKPLLQTCLRKTGGRYGK